MRLAVISDIHGSAYALETALRDLDEVSPDKVVCLGDAIQGGPQPAECVAILRDKGWPVVMGNADAWLLTGTETSNEIADEVRRRELYDVREWSLSKLNEEDRKYISTFVPNITIDLTKDAEILCFHGSPNDFDEVLLPLSEQEQFKKIFQSCEQRILAGGHTHVQFIRHYRRRFFFNPGSIGFAYRSEQDGLPFRADPWAEYAVLNVTNNSMSLDFRRVAYDPAKLLAIYKSSGRPHYEKTAAQYSPL